MSVKVDGLIMRLALGKATRAALDRRLSSIGLNRGSPHRVGPPPLRGRVPKIASLNAKLAELNLPDKSGSSMRYLPEQKL